MIYCSVLLSHAHTKLRRSLPSRAMLLLMSKRANSPGLCHLPGPAEGSAAARTAWGGLRVPVPKYTRRAPGRRNTERGREAGLLPRHGAARERGAAYGGC